MLLEGTQQFEKLPLSLPAHSSENKLLLISFPRYSQLSQSLLKFFLSFYPFFFLHSRSKLELLMNSVYLLATHSATLNFH